ncbi:MAG: UPF0146 family protein [Halanaeroarchaeum sp.]
MGPAALPRIADVLAAYDRLVEVGVGGRPSVAATLASRGSAVVVTDVVSRDVPAELDVVVDDVTDPDHDVYRDADAIYALRLPPELQRPVWTLARDVDADCLFTTLGGDPVVVPAETRPVASGTLYVTTRN